MANPGETTANNTTAVQPAKKSWKGCIIAILVVLALVICCVVFGVVAFGKLLSVGTEEINSLQTRVSEFCKEKNTASDSEFVTWFTESYKDNNTGNEAQDQLDSAFPSGFDCDSLVTDGIIELAQSGQTVNLVTENGKTTATLSFDNGTESVTFELEKSGDTYLINEIK